jgi:hypothetical protein
MVALDETSPGTSSRDQPPFFAVSLMKFAAMSVCTFGIYELYWFYRNWRLVKERQKVNISPFWRAFFAFFCCYQCFSRIRAQAATVGLDHSLRAGPLAAGWIITAVLWRSQIHIGWSRCSRFYLYCRYRRLQTASTRPWPRVTIRTGVHRLEYRDCDGWDHIFSACNHRIVFARYLEQ